MARALSIFSIVAIICMVIAALGGLTWANMTYARAHPGETDFLVPWLGAQTFLQYGNNPYENPATQRAQLIYYGHLAKEGEDPLRLDVPFPIELFYFPFAFFPEYAFACGLWMTFLEAALVFTILFSLALTGWKSPRALWVVFTIFSVMWIHTWLALIAGNTIIITTLCMVGGLLALRIKKDEVAGALLLLSAFQPLANGILTLFIFWWVLHHHRWRVLWGALMVLGLLLVAGFIFLPGWFLPSLRAIIVEYHAQAYFTPGIVFAGWWPAIGKKIGWLLAILLATLLFLEWHAARGENLRHLLWTISVTLVITPLIGIPTNPDLNAVLIFPLILFLTVIAERWGRPGRWWLVGILLIMICASSWGVTCRLTAHASFASLRTLLVYAIPSLMLIGLYWVRWWAIHPPRTEFGELPR